MRSLADGDLAVARVHELHEAARVLGIAEVMRPASIRTAICAGRTSRSFTSRSCSAIQRYQPDGVITFAEDGLYWHLDHIGVHERTYTAVKSFGAAAPPLYYVTMQHGVMREIVDTAHRERVDAPSRIPSTSSPTRSATTPSRPTFLVDVHDWVPRKLAALRCHRTQIGPNNPFRHLTDEQARRLLGVEQFRRSPLDAGWKSVLEQLGERVTT